MTLENGPQRDIFSLQKTKFFSQEATSVLSALKMHRGEGLWKRIDGKRDWGNVSEHCLVETARVKVFADLLGLSAETKRNLKVASALHDVHKKREKDYVTVHGFSFDSFGQAASESSDLMFKAGFGKEVVEIAGSVGHDSLIDMEEILAKEELSEHEKARLIMHYVDDYTVDSEWANPVSENEEGALINDLDRRVDKNERNPRYAVLNEEGKSHFNGETTFQAQRRIGYLVQKKLAQLIGVRGAEEIDPVNLPTFIDGKIKEKIKEVSLSFSH